MNAENKSHWENVFNTKEENEVSWYQKVPKTSIDLLLKNKISKTAHIIDVGSGDSYFIEYLINENYENIYALDISEKALERLKNRLGKNAEKVNWIVTDILDFVPDVKFDFWHDRASFHFQTTEDEINKYVELVSKSIKTDGVMCIGTFSENGPKKCSGLEISQYNEKSMNDLFEANFQKIDCSFEDHQTPFSTLQNFIFCEFRKK